MTLQLRPISFPDACAFVAEHHRHHIAPQGHKFSIGCEKDGELVGVVIVGRPVSRWRDDGVTLEVTRLCTNGAKNACSMLYGAAARATFAMGYQRIGTYLLAREDGASVKAAGWRLVAFTKGRSWSRPKRGRTDKHPTEDKNLFELAAR